MPRGTETAAALAESLINARTQRVGRSPKINRLVEEGLVGNYEDAFEGLAKAYPAEAPKIRGIFKAAVEKRHHK